jgi:hypothetical protein
MPNYNRKPSETGQAKAARIKRETNQENDSLNLQAGEWIKYSGSIRRFNPKVHIDRNRPTLLRRATHEEAAQAEAQEQRYAFLQEEQEKRKAWHNQPHVQAAEAIRNALEWNLSTVIEKLTPEEWLSFKSRILPAEDESTNGPTPKG